LIKPLAERYPSNDPNQVTPEATAVWNYRYAEHLREAWCEHSEDFDVAALFAEA